MVLLALTAPLVVLLRRSSRIGLAMYACAVVPMVDVVAHATVFDVYVGRYSARDIVAAVDHDPELRSRPLAFLSTSYSSQFYRHGDVTTLAGDTDAIRPFLRQARGGLVAMRKRDWGNLPAAATHDLAIVRTIGAHVLVETTERVVHKH